MLYLKERSIKRKKFQGSSLISILVGLVLGLVSILSVMTVYKTLVFRSADMKSSSKLNSQVGMGLLGSHIDIQKAGYGVEDSINSCLGASIAGPSASANIDFVVISNAVLTAPNAGTSLLTGTLQPIGMVGAAPVSGTAVVWRWIDDLSVSQCAGLVSTGGGLISLLPSNCTNATSWNTQSWAMDRLIELNTLTSAKAVSFTASRVAECSSFGAGEMSPSLSLGIWAGNSADGLSTTASSCIQNICQ